MELYTYQIPPQLAHRKLVHNYITFVIYMHALTGSMQYYLYIGTYLMYTYVHISSFRIPYI